MKVLLITGSFPPMYCGVGDYTAELARALVHAGVEVSVLTGKDAEPCQAVRVFPIMRRWTLRDIPKIVRTIREVSPDVVHIQYPTQGYDGRLPAFLPLIARLMGRRVVQTWHEIYSRERLFFLQALAPSKIIVVRPGYKSALKGAYAWATKSKPFFFIPNVSSIPKTKLTTGELHELKRARLQGQSRLIVFFGFLLPQKGAEMVFDIADPASDHIVFAGPASDMAYKERLAAIADAPPWLGKVSFAGYLEKENAAALLGIADAVVLPFRTGGGEWNTSIHAAMQQGSFVLTTSRTLHGYDQETNVFYAAVDDVGEMKSALETYAGRRSPSDLPQMDGWPMVAELHLRAYAQNPDSRVGASSNSSIRDNEGK